jgi:uncharacterized protein VirK/YbjX
MITTTQFTTITPAWSTGFKDKGMMLIEYAMHPVQTHRWMQFLRRDPMLDALTKVSPHLLSRVHKPYMSPGLSYAERISLLIDHYQIIARTHLGDLLRKSATRPLGLHEFAGRSGQPYQLTLAAVDPSRRDGEMTLRLAAQGTTIYTASFVFATIDGMPCVKLGGLQGLLATDQTLRIKQVTRDLHGCRPRDLMIHAVREIGRGAGCSKMVLIGNANKLPSSERVCRKSSDYDQIWKEWNASRRHDGDYEMACAGDAAGGVAVEAGMTGEPTKRTQLLGAIAEALHTRLVREKAVAEFGMHGRSQVADNGGERFEIRPADTRPGRSR